METPSKFPETPFGVGWGGVGTRRPEADIGWGGVGWDGLGWCWGVGWGGVGWGGEGSVLDNKLGTC